MKLAERLSANLSIMYTEVPFLERFALAARNGFKAVEFWFPYEWPASEIAARLRSHGLKLVGMNTAAGDVAKGDWGLAVDASRHAEFQASVHQALDYAVQLNCPHVHVMAGIVAPDVRHEDARAMYLDNIRWASQQAAAKGIVVFIEPLNPVDRPGYFMSRQSVAMSVIDALREPNLKIMFDIYHVQMTEGRIVSNMLANMPHIGHIQIADVPGRHEPGTGEIRFDYIFDQIAASGWFERGGWVGCEYKPKVHSNQSQGWLRSLK